MMRRVVAVALVASALAALPAAASARTGSPAGHADEMTTVVVTMRGHAHLPITMHGTANGASTERVVRALKVTASHSQAQVRTLLRERSIEGRVADTTPLWITNGISVTATTDVIEELASRRDVLNIVPNDLALTPDTTGAEPNIGNVEAPALWQLGYTGQGVVVANLDSGVDVSHPDLASQWRGGTNSWYDPYGQHPSTPTDLSGHGTATMGLIVGGDAGGTSIGMAPGAHWIAAKVFNDSGGATATALHLAFQWALDPDHDPTTDDAPQVVNGSWSIGSAPGCDLSFQPDVQALRAAGIVPVFAAGNYGPGTASSVSPANYPESYAVGAVDNKDVIYTQSSQGPSTCGGRSTSFPDVVAPGVDVRTADRFGMYQTETGTSLSAPHAVGALALLMDAIPGLPPETVQEALTKTAVDLGSTGPDPQYGNGRIDVLAAYEWLDARRDFAMSIQPTLVRVARGGSATYAIEVTPLCGFTGKVKLSRAAVPPGATTSWTKHGIMTSGTSELHISTSGATPRGTYTLLVSGTFESIVHAVPVSLVVKKADWVP